MKPSVADRVGDSATDFTDFTDCPDVLTSLGDSAGMIPLPALRQSVKIREIRGKNLRRVHQATQLYLHHSG